MGKVKYRSFGAKASYNTFSEASLNYKITLGEKIKKMYI